MITVILFAALTIGARTYDVPPAAMRALFRVTTFEDWTDVMYQTMTVRPLSRLNISRSSF